ncbi:4Fe-4S binding protein [Candidatus Bathyarchaeota archaeon]|nr:4Fe-4S binding protein [Candidatus Bathyarchaeota archaeon]
MTRHSFSTKIAKEAFSNLFKKRATEKYPAVPANVAEGFRGKQVLNLSNCISCGLCARECPSNAIEMVVVDGKKRPLIHLDRCVFCYQCADTCPRKVFETSKVFELAVTDKSTLVIKPESVSPAQVAPPAPAASSTQ